MTVHQNSTTLSVRLTPAVKQRLGRLADLTRRTRSFLAAEAIADYVGRELAILEGIEQGLADMSSGRLVPHKQAMKRLRDSVERAGRRKK
jgi:predicted transcriptional regulator